MIPAARFGVAAAASLLQACSNAHTLNELTPEHRALVQEFATDARSSEGVMKKLIDQAVPLFDAQGVQGNTEQLKADIEATRETLEYFVHENKILQFDSREGDLRESLGSTADSAAFHHYNPWKSGSLEENYIALDVADKGTWSAGVLMHEVGHVYGKHSNSVKNALEDNISGETFTKIVLLEKDFSYLLSELFLIPDEVLRQYKFNLLKDREYIQQQVHEGTLDAQTAEQKLRERFPADIDAWLEEQAFAVTKNFGPELSVLGLDTQEIGSALKDQTFSRYLSELNNEALRELKREIQSEAQRERNQEQSRFPVTGRRL